MASIYVPRPSPWWASLARRLAERWVERTAERQRRRQEDAAAIVTACWPDRRPPMVTSQTDHPASPAPNPAPNPADVRS